jgi:hypothetical protein
VRAVKRNENRFLSAAQVNLSAVNNSQAVERESDFGALTVLGLQGFVT